MHARLPTKGICSCSGSRDLFLIWQISGIISETEVQLKTNKKSYVAYRMAPLRKTFNDIEGHFCCLKHLCLYATVVRVHDGTLAEQYAVSSTTLVVVNVG